MGNLSGNMLFAAIVCLTSLCFGQIGWDNGLMGGLINGRAFNDTFHTPGATIIGLIVAILEVGCFFGSVFSSFVGEQLGRKKSIAIGVSIMIIGALLQATSYSRAQLMVARIIAGFGLGVINSTAPVLLAEFAPKATRGLFVCMQLTVLNFFVTIVYWTDFGLSYHTGSYAWRIPVILQCVFLIPMLMIALFVIPETPRWLAAHDRPDEALEVLRRVRKGQMTDEAIVKLHEDILHTLSVEDAVGSGTWKDLLRDDELHSRRRLLISCGIQIFQQLGGINAIIYYSGTLFQNSIGFSSHMSSLMAGFLQTWFFVASFIPWLLIDRVGRIPLFLSMISLMALVMATQAGLIYQVQHKTASAHSAGIAAAVMLFIFEGAFTVGFQATVWVYPSEILPLRLRQRGSSISTASNWIMNFAIVMFTPSAIQNIGWRTYIIFAVLNAFWVPIIWLFFPETKGMELEDVDRLFADKNRRKGSAVDQFYEEKPRSTNIENGDKQLSGAVRDV